MTFLVIGSNSFSGSNYVNYLLKSNYRVIGVSRSNAVHSSFLPYLWENKKKTLHKINLYLSKLT